MTSLFKRLAVAAIATVASIAAAVPAVACPNFSLQPAYGAASLAAGFLPDPHEVSIQAGGAHAVGGCIGQGIGFVAAAPDYSLNWSGRSGRLTFWVESTADTVLIVNAPDGVYHFNDDNLSGDLRPGLTFLNPIEGRYDIWVGTYSSGPLQPSRLLITELF